MMKYRQRGEQLLFKHYHPYPGNGRAHGAEWVQYRDLLPPETLRGTEWVERCYDVWPGQFMSGMTAIGLIPVGGNAGSNSYYAVQQFNRLSPMQAVLNLSQMVTWNNKPEELNRAKQYARTVFTDHRHAQSGWYYGVDADTGVPCADRHNITSYGLLQAGLDALGLAQEASEVRSVVNQYIAQHDRALPEQWTAYGPLVQDWSSDGCYYVRSLADDEYRRDWAEFYSAEYYKAAWGHPTTHRTGESWYSDGIVNQLMMHVVSERLDFFDASWRTLQRESIDGLIPEMVTNGKGNGEPHGHQELALEALVERAEATGLASDIYEAKRFADFLLSRNAWSKDAMFGRDLIRLGNLLGE